MAQKQHLNRQNGPHPEDMLSITLYMLVLAIIGAAIFFSAPQN